MRRTAARLLLLAALPCALATSKQGREIVSAFVGRLRRSPAGQPALVLDVGANNGYWGATVTKRARERAPHAVVDLVYFEPQLTHQAPLQRHAARLRNTTVVHAAAWTRNTTLTFYLAERDSQASSTVETLARRFSGGSVRVGKRAVKQTTVPAVDLAEFMRRRLAGPSPPLVLLKLDVEAAEYEVLPHLLLSGVACSVRYWFIEWHYNALPPKRRLAGVLLRQSVDELISRGCPEPTVIEHDDAVVNNDGRVPGLTALAAEYQNRSALWRTSAYTMLHGDKGL